MHPCDFVCQKCVNKCLNNKVEASITCHFEIPTVQNSVKTNVSRPLSKPRVRNPLTSKIKEHSTNLASVPKHTDSPTLLEREFLTSANNTSGPSAGWGETSWDEEYFKMIPEDTTILNSSLSSSLSSLCAARDLESAKTVGEVSLYFVRADAQLILFVYTVFCIHMWNISHTSSPKALQYHKFHPN